MTNQQRQQSINRMLKVLRQHYKPIIPNVTRPLLEQVLFACCLEDAHYDVAERAFAKLGEGFFDLNEIRVTTVAELAETLADLPDPARSGLALRRVLQGVFESSYSFSLDHAKKHSIAHGVKTLEHLHGISPFVVSFVVSTALGGHAVPLDRGALAALWLSGAISREEYDVGKAAWLERIVPKKSGLEFGSLLHQFGADIVRNVHSPGVRRILLAIDASSKDRLPKRGGSLPDRNPPPPSTGKEGRRAVEAADQHRPAGPQAAARPAGKTPTPPTGPSSRGGGKPGKPGPKPFVVKPHVGKPITIKPELSRPETKPEPSKPVSGKGSGGGKAAGPNKAASAGKGSSKARPGGTAKKKAASKSDARKTHSRELAKKKPR